MLFSDLDIGEETERCATNPNESTECQDSEIRQNVPQSKISNIEVPVHSLASEIPSSSNIDPDDFSNYTKKSLSENEIIQILSSRDFGKEISAYPTTKARKYSKEWEKRYSWLRYSVLEDASYCSYCVSFGQGDGLFKTKGFSDWKNAVGEKRGTFKLHEISKMHKEAMEKSENLLSVSQGEKANIYSSISKAYEDKVSYNRKVLLSIIDVIIVLGQRNIALRGNWDKKLKKEDGNFRFFVDWKAKTDVVLKTHLQSPGPSYLSPDIQNDIIACCDADIRERIVADCTKAGYFAICADGTTDISVKEQVSLCIRFLDHESDEIREEFIGFVELAASDARTMFEKIISFMQSCHLDIAKLRGQGYDGASVMSGRVQGVQARVKEVCPRASYVHCRSHNLNLVITQSCKSVNPIRNLFDSVVQLTFFLSASASRKNILKEELGEHFDETILEAIVEEDEEDEIEDKSAELLVKSKKKIIQPLSETRWSARVDTLTNLITNYSSIQNAVSKIENKSSGEAKSKAGGHRRLLDDPEFIVALCVTQFVLSYLNCLTKSLQNKDCDMVLAYDDAANTLKTLRQLRTDEHFRKVYKRAQAIAAKQEIPLVPRRRTGRQVHRDNPTVDSAEQLWRTTIYFAFLDHVCTEMERRFPHDQRQMMLGQNLVPSKLANLNDTIQDELLQVHSPDLPDVNTWEQEVTRWKVKFSDIPNAKLPGTLKSSLKQAHQDFYPNIRRIFVLLLTMPVTSVCCERSFSGLRRLKTWERSTMGEERLCGLAMLHTHRDKDVSREDILLRFDRTGHRKIGKLIFD
ncbi:zinc finger MYM-type protein 1-like [Mytilus edulis]|uniref:zinc finger MYM-type protein 1-like n=1 Tax=Mytilus edulis TaxID=6550 RepID=UPI0039EEDB73